MASDLGIRTTTDWWISTKSPPSILRMFPVPLDAEVKIRELAGIDAALIAAELGIATAKVIRYQRQLGLRPLAANSKCHRYPVNMRGHNRKRKSGACISRIEGTS